MTVEHSNSCGRCAGHRRRAGRAVAFILIGLLGAQLAQGANADAQDDISVEDPAASGSDRASEKDAGPADAPEPNDQAAAADAEPAPGDDKQTTDNGKVDDKKKDVDVFLPTERISEDYSVAFPADI